jgi:hypothetical protein
MAKKWTVAQRDLFEGPSPSAPLAPAARAKAVEQLQALLIEAILTDQREPGDDQDHA